MARWVAASAQESRGHAVVRLSGDPGPAGLAHAAVASAAPAAAVHQASLRLSHGRSPIRRSLFAGRSRPCSARANRPARKNRRRRFRPAELVRPGAALASPGHVSFVVRQLHLRSRPPGSRPVRPVVLGRSRVVDGRTGRHLGGLGNRRFLWRHFRLPGRKNRQRDDAAGRYSLLHSLHFCGDLSDHHSQRAVH